MEACKYRDIRIYGKRQLDTLGPEDTYDVITYTGEEVTEERRMQKRMDIKGNLEKVKELKEEQKRKVERREQQEEDEQVVSLVSRKVMDVDKAREEVRQTRRPRLELLKRERSEHGERRRGIQQAARDSIARVSP